MKNHILNKTIEILSSSGIEGLSLREVAKQLNLTHQAPYHYFPDKAALLSEVKAQGFRDLSEKMQEALHNPDGGSAYLKLRKIGEVYFEFCMKNQGLFRVMFTSSPGIENVRTPEAVAAFQVLLGCIHELQSQGKLKNYSAEIMAMICWTSMHGLVSLAMEKYPVLGGKMTMEELSEQMLTQLHRLMGE